MNRLTRLGSEGVLFPKLDRRKVFFGLQGLILAVLFFQIYNYSSSWFVKARFRQLSVELQSKSIAMILQPRYMIWTKWYSTLMDLKIPEGSKVLFVRDLKLEGIEMPSEKYLYLFTQTYANNSYVFYYNMFEPINDWSELKAYMKKNGFSYWAVFVKKPGRPDNESLFEIYHLENNTLKLIGTHG
jgi:hypothetical protein